MDIFTKVANTSKLIKKAAIEKEAFLTSIIKGLGGFAIKRPLQTASAVLEGQDVASRTSEAQKAVREAKNRAHLQNTATRV